VFVISLVLVGYDMVTNTRPSQELLVIQLLGLGCGLIVLMRNRRRKS
jgi:F0F1-type ATP synthase assembly protein I